MVLLDDTYQGLALGEPVHRIDMWCTFRQLERAPFNLSFFVVSAAFHIAGRCGGFLGYRWPRCSQAFQHDDCEGARRKG